MREIIEGAEARATAIEDEARRRADEIEAATDRRVEQLLQAALEQTTVMLHAIEAAEGGVIDTIQLLRSETEKLATEFKSARDQAASAPEEAATAEADDATDGSPDASSSEEGPATAQEPASQPEPAAASQPEPAPEDDGPSRAGDLSFPSDRPEPSFELREMIRAQVLTMFHNGKPRAEAERFLMRFKEGENYVDLLDEIYTGRDSPQPKPRRRRRGILRR